jgi:hypothetical protein
MIGTVVIGSAALGAWLAAPFVAMGRKGTIDGRSRAGLRADGLRVEAIRRAHRREALVATATATATVSIPAPRGTEHDVLPQRSVLVGV